MLHGSKICRSGGNFVGDLILFSGQEADLITTELIQDRINKNVLRIFFPGKTYDERVDIFSFGIMTCEVRKSG